MAAAFIPGLYEYSVGSGEFVSDKASPPVQHSRHLISHTPSPVWFPFTNMKDLGILPVWPVSSVDFHCVSLVGSLQPSLLQTPLFWGSIFQDVSHLNPVLHAVFLWNTDMLVLFSVARVNLAQTAHFQGRRCLSVLLPPWMPAAEEAGCSASQD